MEKAAVFPVAFLVQRNECADRLVIGRDLNSKFSFKEFDGTDNSQKRASLAAAGAIVLSDLFKTPSSHQVAQPPFGLRKRRRSSEDADEDARADRGSAGAMEAAESTLYVFGPFSGLPDRIRLLLRSRGLLGEQG